MPKVTVEFSLPEEQEEYDMYKISSEMFQALFEISNLLRSIEKGYEEGSDEMYNENLFEKIRDLISESEIYKIE